MPGPVERWLETFMCKQYADRFEAFGFKTLQSVCQLQVGQLQSMGVSSQDHCEKILENVHVLRQTLSLSGAMNHYPDEMSGTGSYGSSGNGMSHPSMGYPNSESNPMTSMANYMQGYNREQQGGQAASMMMSPPHYPGAGNIYSQHNQQQQQHQQQHQQQQQFMSPHFNSAYHNNYGSTQNPMMMNSMTGAGNPMFRGAAPPSGPGPGGPGASVHPPPHPHQRQTIQQQNPQQVADNILQMASSYSGPQTVQVPLSKGRSAPYHNPRASNLAGYNMQNVQGMSGVTRMAGGVQGMPPGSMSTNIQNMQNMQAMMALQQSMGLSQGMQVMQPTNSPPQMSRHNPHFGYPGSSPHTLPPRTSPISPMPMHSPASQHSNQSVHNNPSPGPMQSPLGQAGGSIQSPVSAAASPSMAGAIPSPCANKQQQMSMTSPSPRQQLCSPIQHMQQHVNSPLSSNCTPISSPSQQMNNNSMRSPMNQQTAHHPMYSQYHHHHQQQQQQLPQGHYSPAPHSLNSPMSHTSSPPYMQGASRSMGPSPPLQSPQTPYSKPSPSGSVGSNMSTYVGQLHVSQIFSTKPSGSEINPLQSLQKLVLLPETQVVDPKSVVNDACLASPSQDLFREETIPKNCDNSSDSARSGGSQIESNRCLDGKHCEGGGGGGNSGRGGVSAGGGGGSHDSVASSRPCPQTHEQTANKANANNGTVNEQKTTCRIDGSGGQGIVQSSFSGRGNSVSSVRPGIQVPAVDNVASREPTSQSNHVHLQEPPPSPVALSPLNLTAADNKNNNPSVKKDTCIQKSKQENMSPKKRFLGSQPLINGGSAAKEEVQIKVSDAGSGFILNGPERPLHKGRKKRSRMLHELSPIVADPPLSFEPNQFPHHLISNITSAAEYVNKKFFKRRRVMESVNLSSGLVSVGCENAEPIGRLNIGTHTASIRSNQTSVLQRTPPVFGAQIYDDVSDISDDDVTGENGGLATVQKDSAFVHSQEIRDPLVSQSLKQFSSTTGNKSFSSSYVSDFDDFDQGNVALLFQNDKITKTAELSETSETPVKKSKGSPTETGRTNSRENDSLKEKPGHSEGTKDLKNVSPDRKDVVKVKAVCSSSVESHDEPDTIVSPVSRLRPKRKIDYKAKDNPNRSLSPGAASSKSENAGVNSSETHPPKLEKHGHISPKATTDSAKPNSKSSPRTSAENFESSAPQDNKNINSQELAAWGMTETKNKSPCGTGHSHQQKVDNFDDEFIKVTEDLELWIAGKVVRTKSDNDDSVEKCVKFSMKQMETSASSGSIRTERKTNISLNQGDVFRSTEGDEGIENELSPLQKSTESAVHDIPVPKKRAPARWKGVISQSERTGGDIKAERADSVEVQKPSGANEINHCKPLKDKLEGNLFAELDKSDDGADKSRLMGTVQEAPSSSKSLPGPEGHALKRKRGRPVGSKNKIPREKKHSKCKGDVFEYNSEDEQKKKKSKKVKVKNSGPKTGQTMMTSSPGKKMKEIVGALPGPFIRVGGTRSNPDKCVIMNAYQEDGDVKPMSKKKKSLQPASTSAASVSVRISNLPSDKSVLVPGVTPSDETLWYCCICRKHSCYKFMGDLFGPYYQEGYQPPSQSSAEDGSDKPKQRRKKMFVLADQVPDYAALIKPIRNKRLSGEKKLGVSPSFEVASGATADSNEVWVHEVCALWSDGAYLIGMKLYGLRETANLASTMACSQCREVGASIGCLHKGCTQKFHYHCAVERDCYLDEENFSMLCPKHKEKKVRMSEPSAGNSRIS